MTQYHLKGLRILNTRPNPQGQLLNEAIIAAGGQAIHYPALTIIPTAKTWLNALPSSISHHAIFISANAVIHGVPDWLKQPSWSETIKLTAIGHATANALVQHGLQVDNIPLIADSEHLLLLNALQDIKDKTILLFKGVGGRTLISDELQRRGAHLIELEVYQRLIPELKTQPWPDKDAIDMVLFTSQEAMQNTLMRLSEDAKIVLKEIPCLLISSRLAAIATQLGWQQTIVCDVDNIMETLHQFNKGLLHG